MLWCMQMLCCFPMFVSLNVLCFQATLARSTIKHMYILWFINKFFYLYITEPYICFAIQIHEKSDLKGDQSC